MAGLDFSKFGKAFLTKKTEKIKSSWNTGVLVESAKDAVGQVASKAMNTVNGLDFSSFGRELKQIGGQVAGKGTEMASDFISDTGEAISGAVGSVTQAVSEALPEIDDVVEGVKDASTNHALAVADTVKTTYRYFKAVTSPVAMNFLDDLLFGRARTAIGIEPIPFTEEYFSDETIILLKTMIKDRGGIKAGETMSFEKGKIYGSLSKKYGSQIRVVQTGGSGSEEIIDALANRNPADEIKNMLGSFTIVADAEGNLTIEDRFNYNEWVHPVTEEEYSKAQFDKAIEAGEFSVSEMIGKSWETYGASYGFVRSLGFLLGSQDTGEEGRKDGRLFKLNLGNLKDL